ncbi:MAG TPA: DUF4157 domain-containing protein [Acidimicrobiales bacterium]|nr:DUF4157 domain-containing protein [Acidimicrobiales bacterium]
MLGNRVAARLLAQPKLVVGSASDPLEAEADAVADQVAASFHGTIARSDVGRPEPSERVRRKAAVGLPIGAEGGDVQAADEAAVDRARTGGTSLPAAFRSHAEGAMAADFSSVRLHTGREATRLNRSFGAEAFTIGNDIFFRDGMPDTSSKAGAHLLSHELTHTVQQGGVRRVHRKTAVPRTPPTGLDVLRDWKQYSAVKGKPRSGELKAIDKAVATWVTKGANHPPGDWKTRLGLLTPVLDAINAWRRTKTDGSVRSLMVADLNDKIDELLVDVRDRQNKAKLAEEKQEAWKKYGGRAGEYAKRGGDSRGGMWDALFERGDDGLITDEALQQLHAAHRKAMLEMLEGYEKGAGLRGGTTKEDAVEKLGATDDLKDQFTGANAEVEQHQKSGSNKGKLVTENQKLAGFPVVVTKDDTDTWGAAARLKALEAALDIVGRRIKQRPTIHVILPKFGRGVSGSKAAGVEVHKEFARAEFYMPDVLLLTPSVLDSTVATSLSAGRAGEDLERYKDERGVWSCVHELGHLMHSVLNPKMFADLNWSVLNGKGIQARARSEVSGYAGGNPKEFVAEVFVGTVMGKTFSPEIMDAYQAFGGPVLDG